MEVGATSLLTFSEHANSKQRKRLLLKNDTGISLIFPILNEIEERGLLFAV